MESKERMRSVTRADGATPTATGVGALKFSCLRSSNVIFRAPPIDLMRADLRVAERTKTLMVKFHDPHILYLSVLCTALLLTTMRIYIGKPILLGRCTSETLSKHSAPGAALESERERGTRGSTALLAPGLLSAGNTAEAAPKAPGPSSKRHRPRHVALWFTSRLPHVRPIPY